MSRARFLPIAVVCGLVAMSLGIFAAAHAGGGEEENVIAIHHSQFLTKELTVKAGQAVTFTLRNNDPIEHEWLIGDDAMHERHRHGTEAVHDQRPDEVTLPAYSTKVTTLTFDQPGDYAFICHLPGHEEYGMRGVVHVVR